MVDRALRWHEAGFAPQHFTKWGVVYGAPVGGQRGKNVASPKGVHCIRGEKGDVLSSRFSSHAVNSILLCSVCAVLASFENISVRRAALPG